MLSCTSEAAYRTSQASERSIARPRASPWRATMTGTGQRSGAPMACWKARMSSCRTSAARAGSEAEGTTLVTASLTENNREES